MVDKLTHENFGRAVFEASADYIIILDPDLKVTYVNRLEPGLHKEDVIGIPLYTLASEEKQQYTKECLESVRATRKSITYETQYNRPDGSTIFLKTLLLQ